MKKIKNVLYLAGPLALVSFALMDYVGGTNYPGYDWLNQSLIDIVAMDSYCLVIGLVFAIIAALLAIFAIFAVYKFFKSWKKISKIFLRGLLCFALAVSVFGIGFNVFHEPQAGTIEYVIDQYQQIKNEKKTINDAQVEMDEANRANSESTSDSSSSDTNNFVGSTTDSSNVSIDNSSSTSTDAASTTDSTATSDSSAATTSTSTQQSTIDSSNEKIAEYTNNILEKISNPMMIGIMVCTIVMLILMIIGAVCVGLGGFKKGGIKSIAWVSVILVGLGFIAVLYNIAGTSYFGISIRVINYLPFALTAFLSAWVYAYEPKER